MLGQDQLAHTLFPVGGMTKADVRVVAHQRGLRTAAKPDSQDVCFIRSDQGRQGFLGERLTLHPGRLVDQASGADLGGVEAVELVTVGQRRGMGHGVDGRRRFVTAVDVPRRRVTLGSARAARADSLVLHTVTWVDGDPWRPGAGPRTAGAPAAAVAFAQCSAHGRPVPCVVRPVPGGASVTFASPERIVAPGQTVALYDARNPDAVIGSGIAA
jgi:tRNA-specific 2-thiouridylase